MKCPTHEIHEMKCQTKKNDFTVPGQVCPWTSICLEHCALVSHPLLLCAKNKQNMVKIKTILKQQQLYEFELNYLNLQCVCVRRSSMTVGTITKESSSKAIKRSEKTHKYLLLINIVLLTIK